MHGFPCQGPKQHTSIGDPGVDACNAYKIMSTAFHNPLRPQFIHWSIRLCGSIQGITAIVHALSYLDGSCLLTSG